MATSSSEAAKQGRRSEPATRELEPQLDQFVALSAALTGFSGAELWGTGMMHVYFALVPSITGEMIFGDLLTRWRDIAVRGSGRRSYIEKLLTEEMLEDPKLGPVARNVAYLWYCGMWQQLPGSWRNTYGANARDLTHVVSSKSYQESLVWKAMHTHPQGAKQPGFASWAMKPEEGAR